MASDRQPLHRSRETSKPSANSEPLPKRRVCTEYGLYKFLTVLYGVSFFVSAHLSVSFSVYVCMCAYFLIALYRLLKLSLPACFYLSLSVCLCLFLFPSVSVSITLSLSFYLCKKLSLSISISAGRRYYR